jgi:glutamate synthase domain-containing protein 3
MKLDAVGLDHQLLNARIREAADKGVGDFLLQNICGQRYIAAGFRRPVNIAIDGVPGNDLGSFMDGPVIRVNGNGQDGVGNTMNAGTIAIDGDARDLAGHSMRGGKLFVRGDVDYRLGVHMKSYAQQFPVIVVGGRAGDFTGEYMAGGVIIILNLNQPNELSVGNLTATGMHGGTIYVRGKIDESTLGKEASCLELDETDHELLRKYVSEFSQLFPDAATDYDGAGFRKLLPLSHRPYGRLYAY